MRKLFQLCIPDRKKAQSVNWIGAKEVEDETQMTDMQSLLQEQYLKSLAGIEDGQIVTGTVVQLNDDYVM